MQLFIAYLAIVYDFKTIARFFIYLAIV